MIWLFWFALLSVVYAYAGFPALLWLRARLMPRKIEAADHAPTVSVVIAAYNEAANIAERIDNLRTQDYPLDRLEIIIASDGSDDGTNEIVQRLAEDESVGGTITLLALPRQSKGVALNAGAETAAGEVLVFSDANTQFAPDAIMQLVRPLADPSVGGVAGNQVYLRGEMSSSTADGERLYWNFDQWLKSLQSRAGSVTSATGAIYATRRSLYQDIPPAVTDDFYVSSGVVEQGKRLVYSHDALAYEPVAEAEGVEFSRKLRVITQGFTSVIYRRALLNPVRYGFYAWQLFSHKILRRLVAVPLLVMAVVCPLLWNHGWIYQAMLALELIAISFFALAFLLRGTSLGKWKPLAAAWFFLMVNTAALASALAILRGRRVVRWEPERHQQQGSPVGTLETVEGRSS